MSIASAPDPQLRYVGSNRSGLGPSGDASLRLDIRGPAGPLDDQCDPAELDRHRYVYEHAKQDEHDVGALQDRIFRSIAARTRARDALRLARVLLTRRARRCSGNTIRGPRGLS